MVGLVVGALAVLATLGGRPSSLEEAAARTRTSLSESASLLETVAIEYREGIADDGGVRSDPEYQASFAALERARGRFDGVAAALAGFDPARAADIEAGFDSLEHAMRRPAPPADVQAEIDGLSTSLRGSPAP